ncbi:MAG: alpha/beta fold hydrolase [Rickettsiales bacterium]|nr:alpha/beta fold hydrolase [Rickettsiales bacterium]
MATLLIAYLLLLTLLFSFQRKLQYVPMGTIQPIENYNLEGFSEKILTTGDGVKILSWYKKPQDLDPKIIVYFHGNAGNLGERVERFSSFSKAGFGVLAITYRGYSGSEGRPSEEGLIFDANAALEFLFENGYSRKDIILFGESLGSGVAMQIANNNKFAAMVLDSPFSSIASVAKRTYWFVPVNLILRDKFDSIEIADRITTPTLVIHSVSDNVVPYEEGIKLFQALSVKKKIITLKNVRHVDANGDFLAQEIEKFLATLSSVEPVETTKEE